MVENRRARLKIYKLIKIFRSVQSPLCVWFLNVLPQRVRRLEFLGPNRLRGREGGGELSNL